MIHNQFIKMIRNYHFTWRHYLKDDVDKSTTKLKRYVRVGISKQRIERVLARAMAEAHA